MRIGAYLFICLCFNSCVYQKLAKMRELDAATFEAVYRSAKGVEAATSVGVTPAKFQDLIIGFAAELSMAKEHMRNSQEFMLIMAYSNALRTYQHSLAVWQRDLDRKITEGIVDEDRLLDEYGIVPVKYLEFHLIPKETVRYLWAIAAAQLARGHSIYLKREPIAPDTNSIVQLRATIYQFLDTSDPNRALERTSSAEWYIRELIESEVFVRAGDPYYHITNSCMGTKSDVDMMLEQKVHGISEAEARKKYKRCSRCFH
jgi:hypothetical protein